MNDTSLRWFPLILLCLGISCKQAKVGAVESFNSDHERELIVLLKDNLSADSLDIFKTKNVKVYKRVSRSENKWLIKINMDQTELERFEVELEGAPDVLTYKLLLTNESENLNKTNTKSGKTAPKSNN